MSDHTTHVDADGLRIPERFRDVDAVTVRTPRMTMQHHGDGFGPYYPLVSARDFGPAESFDSPLNPALAPDQVTVKPHGEPATTLTVETVTDGPLAVAEEVTDDGE